MTQIFQVVGALIHLSGELQFINNRGGEECALHMQSLAQVVLNKELQIMFEGNSGRSGQLIFHAYTYHQQSQLEV